MRTAAEAIAALDADLAAKGQTVTLRRGGIGGVTRTARAFVRRYQVDELVAGFVQGDRQIILSPTGLTEPFLSTPFVRGDEVLLAAGRPVSVQSVEPVVFADTLVRMNVQVRG